MLYLNNKTGEIRDFSCTLNSTVWQPIKKAAEPIEEKTDEKPVRRTKK